MSADGPAIVVRGHEGRRYEGWVALGVSHLRWFGSENPGWMAEPRGQGWHLVKYSQEVRAYLPGFGPNELERLREEFGLLTDAELRRGWCKCVGAAAAPTCSFRSGWPSWKAASKTSSATGTRGSKRRWAGKPPPPDHPGVFSTLLELAQRSTRR